MNPGLVQSFVGCADRWRRRPAGGFTRDGDVKIADETPAPPNPVLNNCSTNAWEMDSCRASFPISMIEIFISEFGERPGAAA